MSSGNSYWDRLYEKLQNIVDSLTGGQPTVNTDYTNVRSSFWRILFEKLDTVIVAIANGGGGGGAIYYFADTAARDAYFGDSANAGKIKNGMGCAIGTASGPFDVYLYTGADGGPYDSTAWGSGVAAYTGPRGPGNFETTDTDTYTSTHSGAEIDDAVDRAASLNHFLFPVSTPAKVWSIAHNLDTSADKICVICHDDTGEVILGDITFTDNNNLVISFSEAVSGSAIIESFA
jgi:hypothetical protein